MAHPKVKELRAISDKAWAQLRAQLHGMEPHLDKSDRPGAVDDAGSAQSSPLRARMEARPRLKSFADKDLPVIDIRPGDTDLSPERKTMTLKQFADALEGQRRDVVNYLEGLSESDLKRKARIPIFKEIMGVDEIDIPTYVGALFGYHWNDHAGQIAKIRKAVGLPDAK
jgi:hypothetical protein